MAFVGIGGGHGKTPLEAIKWTKALGLRAHAKGLSPWSQGQPKTKKEGPLRGVTRVLLSLSTCGAKASLSLSS